MLTRHTVRTAMAALLAAGTVAALTSGAVAAPGDSADTDAGAIHVDCAGATDGVGTADDPLGSIAAVNALDLDPGQQVLFKRGVTCLGQFAPVGQGTAAAPIVVGDYGQASGRAVIDADGATNAVLLKNNAFLHLTDLELIAPGDNTEVRRGVYVYGEDGGTLAGVRLEGLYIHDVRGQLPYLVEPGNAASFKGKGPNASGAIIVDAMGTVTPTAFDDLTIVNNRIDDVDRQGIYFWSNWCRRPELNRWSELCSAPWFPHTDVLVAGNTLTNVGGDGIVITGTIGATVEHNLLDGFNRRSRSYNAGIWTANSERVLMQYNEASHGEGLLDSQAFDIDHATRDVVVRYNLSHDNDGGFLLTCPDAWGTYDFRVYGNISINDGARTFQHGCGNGPIYGGKIFNNTFYVDDVAATIWSDNGIRPDVEIFNNIFVATDSGTFDFVKPADGLTIDHNLMTGFSAPDAATDTITGRADFFDPGGIDAADYRLGPDSDALGAGVAVDLAPLDYFENPVPAESLNLGAYQGPGLERTEANGCTIGLEAPAAPVVDGTATIELRVSNPCDAAIAGGAAIEATMSPDFTLSGSPVLPALAAGATDVVPVTIAVPSTIEPGTYPVTMSARTVAVTSTLTVSDSWHVYAREDFDGSADLPTGWTATHPGDTQIVASDGGRAARLDRVAGATNAVRWNVAPGEAPVRVTMRVKAAQVDNALGIHVLDSDGSPVARLSMADTGLWAYTDGNSFVDAPTSYAADEWYDLSIIVHGAEYEAFVDGRSVGRGATTGTGIPAALRVQIPSSATRAGHFLLDDASFASAVTESDLRPPAPVEPAGATDPAVELQRPQAVEAGHSLGLLLSGFRPGERVAVTGPESSAVGVTEPDGTVRIALPIPVTAAGGAIDVTVTQDQFGEALTLTTNATVVAAEPPSEPDTCSATGEDFEGMTAGEAPTGWTTAGDPEPVVTGEDGHRVLALTRDPATTGLVFALCDIGEQAEPVTVQLAVRASTNASALGIHWLDAAGTPVLRTSMNELGTWSYTNGDAFTDTAIPYTAGEWHVVDLIIADGSYELRVDGAAVGGGSVQSGAPGAQLRLQIPSSAVTAATFEIDDIVFGGEPYDPDGGSDSGADVDGGSDSGAGSDGGSDTGAGSDGGSDTGAGSDGGSDTGAGSDGGSDTGAGSDGGSDTGAGSDGGSDTGAGSDGGSDTGAGSDGAVDAGTDGGADSGAGADGALDGGADVDGGSESGAGVEGGAGSGTDGAVNAEASASGSGTDTDHAPDTDHGPDAPGAGTPAMPETGVSVGMTLAAILLLLGAGVLLRRGRTA
ncbi:hypothetical protein GCG21_00375 [Pseudactinotalea sp. HY160]|nr:hypothetical protein [Pseudactinotalea sp. HY160]